MRRSAAAVVSVVWFGITAGAGAVWLPWRITGWKVGYQSGTGRAAQVLGIALIVAGLVPVVWTFAQFVRARGTPVPGALTERLVVAGFNRYVRNPIYLGVLVIILGEALLLWRLSLIAYAALVWWLTAVFVRRYEEPALARRFGASYEAYRHAVPAWRPRWHGWSPDDPDGPVTDAPRRGRPSR